MLSLTRIAAMLLVTLLALRAGAETFFVTGSQDSGSGSLRDAILKANANPGADTIIGPCGPTVQCSTVNAVKSALPVVTGPVTITGIALNGSGAGSSDGIVFEGGGHTITYAGVFGFQGNGIVVRGSGSLQPTRLSDLLVGYRPDGSPGPIGGTGILVEDAAQVELGRDNGWGSMRVSHCGVSGVTVARSRDVAILGLHAGGIAAGASGNSGAGVRVTDSGQVRISNSAVAGNGGHGIEISNSTDVAVLAAQVGTNGQSRGNAGHGFLLQSSPKAAIDSSTSAGNGGDGFHVADSSGLVLRNVTARKNSGDGIRLVRSAGARLGLPIDTFYSAMTVEENAGRGVAVTDVSDGVELLRSRVLSNAVAGVFIENSANVAVGQAGDIATASGSAANVITGSPAGLVISGERSRGNRILANVIGTTPFEGTLPGNRGPGVAIRNGASENLVGESDSRNHIAGNTGAGVAVESGFRNTVGANDFQCNGGLAIDLGSAGATFNDYHDTDRGANELQNAPTLRYASSALGGRLFSAPGTSYRIDFHARPRYGCAETWAGSTQVTTDAAGRASFHFTGPLAHGGAEWFLATATDPAGNTSEFSVPVRVQPGSVFRFAEAAVTAGESTGYAEIAVVRTGGRDWTSSVRYRTRDLEARAGTDYQSVEGRLEFAPGEVSKVLRVPLLADPADAGERFVVEIFEPVDAFIPGENPAKATVTIEERLPRLSVANVTVRESNEDQRLTFEISTDFAAKQAIVADYRTVAGTAAEGPDFEGSAGRVTIPAGQRKAVVSLAVRGDIEEEEDEQFQLVLERPAGAGIAQGAGTATIENDDGVPRIEVADVTATEGESLLIRFRRIRSNHRPSAFNIRGIPGSAGSFDFPRVAQSVYFAAGETEVTLAVGALDDGWKEAPESFTIELSEPENALLPDTVVVGTIVDDDDADVHVEVVGSDVVEGNSGRTRAVFEVILTAPLGYPVTVQYGDATVEEGATPGVDYVRMQGSLTFAPGETRKTVETEVLGDSTPEATERFTLSLNAGGLPVLNLAHGVIVNDDGPELRIDDITVPEDVWASEAAFTVLAGTSPAGEGTTFEYEFLPGTARTSDFDMPAPDVYDGAYQQAGYPLAVGIRNDGEVEGPEQLTLRISRPGFARIVDPEVRVTIVDDDTSEAEEKGVGVRVLDAVTEEPLTGTARRRIPVVLSKPASSWVQVEVQTADGSAVSPGDYGADSFTLQFSPGETTRYVEVEVLGDQQDEPMEWVYVVATSSAGAAIQRATGVLSVYDPGRRPRRQRGVGH